MKSLWTNAQAWKFAIGWFALFSVNALCSSVVIALTGAKWVQLDGQSKFVIVISIVMNWTGTIMAFMSKAAKKVENGQLPFEDTQIITKDQKENG